MQAEFVSVHSLFSGIVQYEIPIYQRNYVWNKDDQWNPLWTDIIDTIRDNEKAEDAAELTKHFTGSIVMRNRRRIVGGVPGYDVIDGQQRLTTFQIILCAIADISNVLDDLSDIATQADAYLENVGLLEQRFSLDREAPQETNEKDQHLYQRPNDKYKVLPTKVDRIPFTSLIDRESDRSSGQIREAYKYFARQITAYMINGDPSFNNSRYSSPRLRMLALIDSILHSFGVVRVLITSDVGSEKIFESINARGRTLNEFDHLRNNLFLKARVTGCDLQEYYEKYWQDFDDSVWTNILKIDNERIMLSEQFIQHFLMAKLGEGPIAFRYLFDVYEKEYRGSLSESQRIDYEFRELKRYSEVYQVMINRKNYSGDSEFGHRMKIIGRRMKFYTILNITGLYPFILLLTNELKISNEELDSVFDILESYTMRHMLCLPRSDKNYDQSFDRLSKKFVTRKDSFSLVNLISQLSDASRWLSDDLVKSVLNGQWTNMGVENKIIRYILYRINLKLTEENKLMEQGNSNILAEFTLEHIMPQAWCGVNWPLPSGKQDLAKKRDEMLQSIGNLTIITADHNERMGNHSYSDKRKSLGRNSNLSLNKEIAYRYENWDVAQIGERTQELVKHFCEIWPSIADFKGKFGVPYEGAIKTWLGSYGFIEANDFQTRIPVSVSDFRDRQNKGSVVLGQKVKFEINQSNDDLKAINVVRI